MTETTNRMNFFTATLHMELNEMKEAEDIYRGLLKRNPENWMYYRKIEECLRLGNSFFDISVSQQVCNFLHVKVGPQGGGTW